MSPMLSSSLSSSASIDYGAESLVRAEGMSLYPDTSPNAVAFNGLTYVFFTGSGGNGIWFTSNGQGVWQRARQIVPPGQVFAGIRVTSYPCTAVFRPPVGPPRLFLFYTANGGDGIYLITTLDVVNWTTAQKLTPANELRGIGISTFTSPSAVVVDDTIQLFYTGNGSDGIYSLISSPNVSGWTGHTFHITVMNTAPQLTLNILMGTTPSAVMYGDEIYLFFTAGGTKSGTIPFNGTTTAAVGDTNSIWYTSSSNGLTWSQPLSLQSAVNSGVVAVNKGSSPAAVVAGTSLYVFWFSPSGLQGTYTIDGKSWQPVAPFSSALGSAKITNACSALVGADPTLFWTTRDNVVASCPFVPAYSVATRFSTLAAVGEQRNFDLVMPLTTPMQSLQRSLNVSTSPQVLTPELVQNRYLTLEDQNSTLPAVPANPPTTSIDEQVGRFVGLVLGLLSLAAKLVICYQCGSSLIARLRGLSRPTLPTVPPGSPGIPPP